MIFTTTLSLILALAPATLLAAPTQVSDSVAALIPRHDLPKAVLDQLVKTNGLCDLSKVTLPVGTSSSFPNIQVIDTNGTTAPTPLPAVSEGATLRHIAIGRGTQNYTCASSSASATPVAIGAIASLFNATCDSARLNDRVMADVTTLALSYAVPKGAEASQRLSGHHEFTEKGIPLFKLQTENNNYGYVQAKPDVVKSAGVNGQGSVAWLKLNAVEGDYSEVYRVHTAGGQPPKTCEGKGASFTVDYSAQYWFYSK
jgi:hypothetical protein